MLRPSKLVSYLVITLSEIFMLEMTCVVVWMNLFERVLCVCVDGGDGQALRFIVSFSAHSLQLGGI